MKIEIDVVPVKIDYICDSCGEGEMRPIGGALMSNPPQYPHICTNCGDRQSYRKCFPYIDFRIK